MRAREPDLFLGVLPRFRDQDLARKVAARLVEMEPHERWPEHFEAARLTWLAAFVQPEAGRPPEIEIERQAEIYCTWRADHPSWVDLFPPTLPSVGSER